MKFSFILMILISFSGCAKYMKGDTGNMGPQGPAGPSGNPGMGAGIETETIPNGDTRCSAGNGGFQVTTFLDPTNTGFYRVGDAITSVQVLCNGATGQRGASGNDGTSSTVGLSAATTNECPNGGWDISTTNGNVTNPNVTVCNGNDGSVGLTGPIGPVGPSGSPGTTITPIQFCPGTPTYPTTFPEYGFVIGGKIYAVYSTNGGFMTMIPPGRYTSNAVGSRCDFTVNANGTISQ